MYNFSVGKKNQGKDPYAYNVGDDDEDDVPSYMAKAKKTGGFGLGLGKKNSLNGGTSKFGASGGSFYGNQKKQDPYDYDDEYEYGGEGDEYGYGEEEGYGDEYEYGDEYGYGDEPQPKPTGFSSAFGQSSGQAQTSIKAASGNQKSKKDIVPKRFALSYNPPVIVLEYLVAATGKLYHHKMKLLKLKPDTPSQDALDYIKKKHFQYFIGGKIDDEQIITLVDKLKQRLVLQAGGTVNKQQEMNNFMSKKKQIVSQVTKKAPYDYDAELGDDYGDDYYDAEEYQDLNLNKLNTEELQKHKNKMETTFKKNSLRPGDAGYEYEINQDFEPDQSNEWDD